MILQHFCGRLRSRSAQNPSAPPENGLRRLFPLALSLAPPFALGTSILIKYELRSTIRRDKRLDKGHYFQFN